MRKIILVDDDLSLSTLLKTLLEMEGFQVLATGRASEPEILDLIRREQPDLVLMDVHIREVDGIRLLQQLKQESHAAPSTIIMTSGMDVRDQCLRAGADAFLLKPYMPDELLALVHA